MKYAVILLRYLKGYVRVRAEGGFPERFINLCHGKRINIWDVFLSDNTLTFCVCIRDYPRLRTVSAKSGVRIKISSRTGLVYQYRRRRHRIGLATGTILFVLVHLILSMFVWCTDVQGNNEISRTDILTRAEHYGLKAGTIKKTFDEISAARKIAADYNGKITWLSVNIKGSLAVIELREDNNLINKTEDRPPCNIVADFDGIILSTETFYGDCMIESGTGVRKGDLLISGAIVNEDLSTDFYAAKGKITALHDKEISIKGSTDRKLRITKINSKAVRIGFLGLDLYLGKKADENSYAIKERKTLNINGYNLPFYIERVLICSKEDKDAENNKSFINELEKIQHSIYKENGNSTVISCDESLRLDKSTLIYIGKYTLIDFLGEEKSILSAESK